MTSATAAQSIERQDRLTAWGLRLSLFASLAVAWEVFAAVSGSLLMPTFTETIGAVIQLTIVDRRLWGPLIDSNMAMILGFGVSAAVGVPLGLAAGRAVKLERVIDPYVAILLAMPMAPLIPIVIIALGLSLTARVAIVVLFCFVFIFVNARAGVRNVDPLMTEMAISFGATERQLWQKVVLPAALPAIFAGLRIGLGRAITGMVVVELLLVASGVGRLLLAFQGRLQSDNVFAVVLVIIVEALLLIEALRWVERRLAPWARDIANSTQR